ncbi:MAG: hypothetical protein E7332_06610 [Clostridiales bacterium]|nr:hypothetical protein [Clostridiales bacterium]
MHDGLYRHLLTMLTNYGGIKMKKYLAFALALALIFSFALAGCGKKEQEQPSDAEASASAVPTATPVPYDKQIEFAVQLLDTAGNPLSGGQLSVSVNPDVFSATADSEGKLTIPDLPAMNRMPSKITDSSGAEKASFRITIWNGYPLLCYTNQDIISIDIEKETMKVYAVLQLTEEGYAECKSVSAEGFAQEDPTPTPSNTEGEGTTDPEQGGQNLGTKYVNSTGVNVRSQPSTSGEKVATLDMGDEVTITDNGTADGSYTWYAISFGGGKTGYIRNDFLSDMMKVGKDGVNMRASSSTSSSKVTTLSINTKVYVLDQGTTDGEYTWYKVRCKSGSKEYTGYIRNDMLTEA